MLSLLQCSFRSSIALTINLQIFLYLYRFPDRIQKTLNNSKDNNSNDINKHNKSNYLKNRNNKDNDQDKNNSNLFIIIIIITLIFSISVVIAVIVFSLLFHVSNEGNYSVNDNDNG